MSWFESIDGSDPSVALAAKIARYRQDPSAYFREQLKIRTKDGTIAPLVPWPCQQPVIDAMMRQRKETGMVRIICLKARQVGLSTLSEGYIANLVMLNPNTNGLVVAHDTATAETLFSFSKTFYDNLDPDIKPMKRYSTKREYLFENPDDNSRATNPGLGSRLVITSANNLHSGVGRTLRAVHISECARFGNPEGIVDGIFPALAKKPGTACILESTAQYAGLWFKEFCERARRGDGDYRFVFVPWYLQPEYRVPLFPGEKMTLDLHEKQIMKEYGLSLEQIKFFRQELATSGNAALVAQNYPLTPEEAWITPGDQAFPWGKLDEQTRTNVRQPSRICDVFPGPRILDHPNGRLQIWAEPEPGAAYDLACDPALGTDETDQDNSDRDWSAICIVKRGTLEQVAQWRSRSIDVIDLATICYWLGKYYNTAQIAVEVNGVGIATSMHLSKMGYSNTYRWRYRDEVSTRFTKKVGWETNHRTKKWIISFAIHELVNDRVIIRSRELIDEMRNFVHLGNDRYGGAAGHHDDLCLAFMIALTISDDENFEQWSGMGQSRIVKAIQNDPRVVAAMEPYQYDSTFMRKDSSNKEYAAWD